MSRTVLIVSPHFPPIGAADMHRVRMALPYFAEFGWTPIVLTVDPNAVEGIQEPLLLESVPPGTPIVRTRALPVRWTRKLGLGNLGLRALPFLYQAGCRLLRDYSVDVVYFSTTVFVTMALGRLWKSKFGVPFVLDMQDPWINDYVERTPKLQPPKYWFMRHVHRTLEPWTMRRVDGLVAVSANYIEVLRDRYPRLVSTFADTIPFGATDKDFDILRTHPQPNRFFEPRNGETHGVYVGRAGHDMIPSLRIIFGALRQGIERYPAQFSNLRLHFIGTSYAPDGDSAKTVEPIAREMGVGQFVKEHTRRVPYFESLQLLFDADFLMVVGSDDVHYSASKIYPYILARKPLVGAVHQDCGMWDNLRPLTSAIVPFSLDLPATVSACSLVERWRDHLDALPGNPVYEESAIAPYQARELTRRQCALFERAMHAGHAPELEYAVQ
jgi:hypothetical protein